MEFKHCLKLLLRKQWNTIGKFKNKRNFFIFQYFSLISFLFDSVKEKIIRTQFYGIWTSFSAFIVETIEYNRKIKEQKKLFHFSIFFINFIFI